MAEAARRGRLFFGDVRGMVMVRFPGGPRLDGIIDARTGVNVYCHCVKLGGNPVPLAFCVCSTFLPSGHWYVFAAVPSAHGFLSPSLVAYGFLHSPSKRNPCHFACQLCCDRVTGISRNVSILSKLSRKVEPPETPPNSPFPDRLGLISRCGRGRQPCCRALIRCCGRSSPGTRCRWPRS